MELFEFIENLFTKAQIVDSSVPFKETYMAVKFLSLYPGTFDISIEANRLLTKCPNWVVNVFLFHSIKKQKTPRFHYPKKEDTQKKWPKEAIQKISRKFCCSEFHSVQILNILSLKHDKILEDLGIGKEVIGAPKQNKRVSKKRISKK